ncbi:phosphopantothenoylcysteine synthetase/decarboxylase [Opitutaceae bacterium TAV1]|nr:phosphopantothenoylcysteine synthetase/decarboxylase [Opitutaceae bacterium TAV1]
MKILVTSGATREPIDAVRFVSNISSGATGAALADALAARGHAVTLLHGEGAVLPRTVADTRRFGSTADLRDRLRALLGAGDCDAVIQCAAVSDYRPDTVEAGKLTSRADEMILRLVPTPKLLPELRSYAPPGGRPLFVIGFKLTAGADEAAQAQAVARLFAAGTVDAVIHNDTATLGQGAARPFHAWRNARTPPETLAGQAALAGWIDRELERHAGRKSR